MSEHGSSAIRGMLPAAGENRAGLVAGVLIADRQLLEELDQCLGDRPVQVAFRQTDTPDWVEFLCRLQTLRPDVLFLELGQARGEIEEVVRAIRTACPTCTVVIVNASADVQAILAAVRAGVGEFLYSPLRDKIGLALDRIMESRAKRHAGKPGGRVVGFLSAKGGCGATTLACHAAVELHHALAQETLLAELDLQVGILAFLLKVKAPYTILDAARNTSRIDPSYWKGLVLRYSGVDVIAAPPPSGADEVLDPNAFREVLQFVRSEYRWTIADLGRGLNPFLMALLPEFDEVFLVSTVELPALFCARNIVQLLLETGFGQDRIRLVLNRAPKVWSIAPAEVEKLVGVPSYAKLPSAYGELHSAYMDGKLLPSRSPLRRQFAHLARAITGMPDEQEAPNKPAWFSNWSRIVPGWGF